MKLPLAYYGNPILRKKGALIVNIDDKIHQLVHDMVETMEANDGCGLAAPQVHESLALFIICMPRHIDENTTLPGELKVFINPKILSVSSETWSREEGCLSIPGLYEEIIRPFKVVVQATNLKGETFTEEFNEWDARAILHENDHLNGVLHIDRISVKRKKEIEAKLKEIKKKYN